MPNTPISGFTSGAPAQSGDEFVVARSGANFKLASSDIKTLIIGAGSVSIASGKTFTASNTLTLAGTDSTTMTFPSTSATIARTDAGNTFTGNQVITEAVGGSGLSITGATQTTSQPVLNLSQTWNAAANFDGIKFNATATSANVASASSMGSLLINLQRNGYTYFSVGNFNASIPAIWLGGASGNSGTQGTANFVLSNDGGNLILNAPSAGGLIWLTAGSSKHTFITPTSFNISSNSSLRFTTDVNTAGDTILTRAAAATLQLGAADTNASSTVTITIATPGVVTWNGHGLSTGTPVVFSTTGALPTGITAGTTYYVIAVNANTFQIATSYANATAVSPTAVDTSGTQSGTHTVTRGAVDQVFRVQSASGTANFPGADFAIQGSRGTGTGAGGSIIFQVAPASGSSNGVQNALSTLLSINPSNYVMVGPTTRSNTFALSFGLGTSYYTRIYNPAAWVVDIDINSTPGGANNGSYPGFRFDVVDSFIAWSGAGAARDVRLYRDTTSTLALRNGTNAQLFRVYSTYNGTNDAYGAIGAAVNLDGTSGDANTLYIGSQKKGSPTALTKLAIQVDGTTRIDYGVTNGTALTLTASQVVINECNIRLGDTRFMFWQNRTILASPADGQLTLWNNAGSDFGRLNFGGITSSFPALKRSTTTLQVRLADDSAFGSFQTGGFSGGAPTIKTANYTQLEADYSLIFNGTGSITLTLLAAATYPGKILYVKTIAAQTVVSASSNVKPIDTDTAGTAILAATAGKWAMLQSDGTDWVIMAQG